MVDNSNMPHPKCLGSQKNPCTEPKTCEKGPKLGFEYLPTSKTSHCERTACMAFPKNCQILTRHQRIGAQSRCKLGKSAPKLGSGLQLARTITLTLLLHPLLCRMSSSCIKQLSSCPSGCTTSGFSVTCRWHMPDGTPQRDIAPLVREWCFFSHRPTKQGSVLTHHNLSSHLATVIANLLSLSECHTPSHTCPVCASLFCV